MNRINKNPGSYKDPAGSIYNYDGRILRSVKNLSVL